MRSSYNGYFSAELILDLTLLISIWTFLLDDLEELFDTHLGGGGRSVLLRVSISMMLMDKVGWR
jgi:hypothetical protein